MNPSLQANAACEIYCCAALADTADGTVYSDLTGKFPVRSFKGNQYIFLAYIYDANAILVRPMKNREASSHVAAFKSIYTYLKNRNFKPALHVMDNECSKIVRDYIENDTSTRIQFVEAHHHKVNAAERAIQTFKNHLLAGL